MLVSPSEPRMVILVVEDEPLVRIFIADFLDEAGFKVLEVANADEAVTILTARSDVQAFITDIQLPKGSMTGLELTRVVQERWPGVGVGSHQGRSIQTLHGMRRRSRRCVSAASPIGGGVLAQTSAASSSITATAFWMA